MCSSHENTSHAAGATKIEGTTFQVPEMSCGHCAGSIRKAFDQMMPGVGVGIDLDKREVTVAGDPAIAVETIRAAGYEPQPLAQ
jgi:copper chaperone